MLERALRQAGSQFNTDSSNPTVGFVRLSGALHCEERAAFQEIAHQLCRCVCPCALLQLLFFKANQQQGRSPTSSSTSLSCVNTTDRPGALILRACSRPPPTPPGCSTFNIPFSRSASFDDNLAFFKEVLAELHRWVVVCRQTG